MDCLYINILNVRTKTILLWLHVDHQVAQHDRAGVVNQSSWY